MSIPRLKSCVAGFVAFLVLGAAAASDGDGTVTFGELQWALETNGSDIPWPEAIEYCNELELAGHDDWRLPSMAELKTLHDPGSDDGYGIRSPIHIETCCLWSGESLVDRPAPDGDETAGPPDRYHWGFMFDGGLEYYAVHIFDDGQALCVREIESLPVPDHPTAGNDRQPDQQ